MKHQEESTINNNNNNNKTNNNTTTLDFVANDTLDDGNMTTKIARRPKDNYKLMYRVGKGSFGVVYKAMDLMNKREVAIKMIDLGSSDDDLQDMMVELTSLCGLNSPYIIKYYTSFAEASYLWIVMEYMSFGSVSDLIKSTNHGLAEKYCRYVAHKICLCLEYLGQHNILHRDIKSANVLIGMDGSIKLADFGVAGRLTMTVQKRKTFVGTPFWMAPEVIQEDSYDQKADIWAMGITCYEMANCLPPYFTQSPLRALFAIVNNDPPEMSKNFSPQFCNFVSCCLMKDPEKRPHIYELLRHPWFSKKIKKNTILELISQIEKKRMKQKKNLSSEIRKDSQKNPDDHLNMQISNKIHNTINKKSHGDTVITPMDFNINKKQPSSNSNRHESKVSNRSDESSSRIHTKMNSKTDHNEKKYSEVNSNELIDPAKSLHRQHPTNSNNIKVQLDTKSRINNYYNRPHNNNNSNISAANPLSVPTLLANDDNINKDQSNNSPSSKSIDISDVESKFLIMPSHSFDGTSSNTKISSKTKSSSNKINNAQNIIKSKINDLSSIRNSGSEFVRDPPDASMVHSSIPTHSRFSVSSPFTGAIAGNVHGINYRPKLNQLINVIKRYQLYAQVEASEKDDPTNALIDLLNTSSIGCLNSYENILVNLYKNFD